jgi:hypothetical protein
MSYFLFAMASPRFVVVDNLVGGWWLVAGGCPKRAVEHETTNPRADKQKNRKEGKGHHSFSVCSLARNTMILSLLASNDANAQHALTK